MDKGDGRDDSSGDEAAHLTIRTLRAREDERRQTEKGMKVQEDIFYSYYRMLSSTNPGWIQTKFDMLKVLFDQVGIKMDVWTTVEVVYHPFREARLFSDKAYTRQMMVSGRSYKERYQDWFR